MEVGQPLGVVTPTLDGTVLTRLARADTAFTTGQLHRLIPDVSVEGIRRVLKRLHRQGIVTATSAGPGVLYALNREHLAAPAIIALAEQPATLRHRLSDLLAGWTHPPVYAAIFGSWATDLPDEIWEDQVAALEHAVTSWTGNDARTLVLSEGELTRVDVDPVLGSILADGLTLHGSAAWFRTTVGTASGEHGGSDAHDESRRRDARRADGQGAAVRGRRT
jgi:DNA-binding HxlR family transcriptional regulator